MKHTRIRPFNTKDTYPELNLDNDLCQAVVANGAAAAGNLLATADVPRRLVEAWRAAGGPAETRLLADLTALLDVWPPQRDDYITRALDPTAAPSYGVPGNE